MRGHNRWLDQDAGPVVRPYALTGGRTDPAGGAVFDLMSVIRAAPQPPGPADAAGLCPEHRRILRLCKGPVTVADVAADTTLPVGVVRVLLADLIERNLISVVPPGTSDQRATVDILKEVLHGLRAL